MNNLSVFGSTGYIGRTYCKLYPNQYFIPRNQVFPESSDVLYLISTTTNQNVFKNVHLDIDTNLSHLMKVLPNCKPGTVFNFVSSCFVYGNNVIDAEEHDPCNPTGFYSITKRCAESLVISYCKTFGIEYRIFRIGNVYGLDPTITPGKNVLGYMIRCLKNDEPIKLYEGGYYLKDYMYVDDVCVSMNTLMESSNTNEIYNIGTGISCSFREIIDYCKEKVGSQSKILDVPFPKDQEFLQIKNMTLNVDKLKLHDFTSKLLITQGLDEMCRVY